jgi:hypothetical protein
MKSFCGCFTDRGGFFKKSPWPPEAKNRQEKRKKNPGEREREDMDKR